MEKIIKAYKGFHKDMTCTGGKQVYQYEEGEEYEEERTKVCSYGFHACKYPLDCLNYYPPNTSVYHEVEQSGETSSEYRDSKIASTKIKIGAPINIVGLTKAAIEYTMGNSCGFDSEAGSWNNDWLRASIAAGKCGASTTTGEREVSTATGEHGASMATGKCGVSRETGEHGISSVTDTYGAFAVTGEEGKSAADGERVISAATRAYGASEASGKGNVSVATGYCGMSAAVGMGVVSAATGAHGISTVEGKGGVSVVTGYRGEALACDRGSIVIVWGYQSRAKGVLGSHLVFADWKIKDGEIQDWKPDSWMLKGVKLVQVDGEKIKPDTWYKMKNGEIIAEAESIEPHVGSYSKMGLATGFDDLDKAIGGLKKGNLYVLAGNASTGKTTFACDLAKNVARNGRKVLFATLELGEWHVVKMLKMMNPNEDISNIVIEDEIEGSIPFYLQRLREEKPDLMIIDYIQLLGYDEAYQVKQERMEQTLRGLKKLAIHENIPVFAISQLRRFLCSDPYPVLDDLVSTLGKESLGEIDVVLLSYRDEQEMRNCNRHKLTIEIMTARNPYGGNELLKYDLSVNFDD